jgi:glycosyltransferase involved in cell wall biosynthesis
MFLAANNPMSEVVSLKVSDDLAEGSPFARDLLRAVPLPGDPRPISKGHHVLFDSSQESKATRAALVSIIIPLWNEEDGIDPLIQRLLRLPQDTFTNWELIFVDDGSSDETVARLIHQIDQFARWKIVRLARNFGQQAAYRAGLDHATGDAVVFLDGDLQDPPEMIPELVARWRKGAKVVTGCRRSRPEKGLRGLLLRVFHETFFYLNGGVMPKNSGTFGLMDRAVADHLRQMPELNLFLPAQRSWIGYQKDVVWYDREARVVGAPKQSFHRLFSYAWDGIANFSELPLKLISVLGILISLAGFAYAGILFAIKLAQLAGFFPALIVQGFTTIAVAMLCLGGIQLICLGIIGEYLARIYREVKRRPLYLVDQVRSSSNP